VGFCFGPPALLGIPGKRRRMESKS